MIFRSLELPWGLSLKLGNLRIYPSPSQRQLSGKWIQVKKRSQSFPDNVPNLGGSKVSSSRSRPYPPPTSGIRMEMAATNYDLRSKSGAGKSSPGREAASQLPPDTKALIGVF